MQIDKKFDETEENVNSCLALIEALNDKVGLNEQNLDKYIT